MPAAIDSNAFDLGRSSDERDIIISQIPDLFLPHCGMISKRSEYDR